MIGVPDYLRLKRPEYAILDVEQASADQVDLQVRKAMEALKSFNHFASHSVFNWPWSTLLAVESSVREANT